MYRVTLDVCHRDAGLDINEISVYLCVCMRVCVQDLNDHGAIIGILIETLERLVQTLSLKKG